MIIVKLHVWVHVYSYLAYHYIMNVMVKAKSVKVVL